MIHDWKFVCVTDRKNGSAHCQLDVGNYGIGRLISRKSGNIETKQRKIPRSKENFKEICIVAQL